MKFIRLDGGPTIGIDRASLSQWGGVLHSSFFGKDSTFENDYEEMCDFLDKKKSTNLSIIKGHKSEAFLIDLPLPTFIVEADGTSAHLVQIWSSEQGWAKSSITLNDFHNAADWRGDVKLHYKGGEFIIFDSTCSYEDIDDHFSISLERGTYRCEWCHQKRKNQANIVLIRMLKQD